MSTEEHFNPHLLNLIMSHEAAAMQYLGKVAGQDGKIVRNLEMARFAIDTLAMLQEKTAGNLTNDEKRLLDHVLYQLRMNYVDETDKKETEEPTAAPAQPENQRAEDTEPPPKEAE
jgi:DNA replication initiation complex subunit (GINS family)